MNRYATSIAIICLTFFVLYLASKPTFCIDSPVFMMLSATGLVISVFFGFLPIVLKPWRASLDTMLSVRTFSLVGVLAGVVSLGVLFKNIQLLPYLLGC